MAILDIRSFASYRFDISAEHIETIYQDDYASTSCGARGRGGAGLDRLGDRNHALRDPLVGAGCQHQQRAARPMAPHMPRTSSGS